MIAYAFCYLFDTTLGKILFFQLAGFFVFLPILGMIPAVILVYYDVGSRKKHFFNQILKNNDITKIFELSAWLNAARVVRGYKHSL